MNRNKSTIEGELAFIKVRTVPAATGSKLPQEKYAGKKKAKAPSAVTSHTNAQLQAAHFHRQAVLDLAVTAQSFAIHAPIRILRVNMLLSTRICLKPK